MKKLETYGDKFNKKIIGYSEEMKGKHIIVKDKSNNIDVLAKIVDRGSYELLYNLTTNRKLTYPLVQNIYEDEELYLVDKYEDLVLKI